VRRARTRRGKRRESRERRCVRRTVLAPFLLVERAEESRLPVLCSRVGECSRTANKASDLSHLSLLGSLPSRLSRQVSLFLLLLYAV
jgi:hypothetical protein